MKFFGFPKALDAKASSSQNRVGARIWGPMVLPTNLGETLLNLASGLLIPSVEVPEYSGVLCPDKR
jgi:hypothetical protein